jgi:hypothetical protein
MNKVISFALYGHKNLYCLGLIENINIINEKYNDWKIYVYYNDIPDNILNILKNKINTYLFECSHNGYKWEGMFWRFYPIENDNIDYFLSRDADSRISDREMRLVNEWISSGKSFHIIRDHPFHNIEILGGTFGVNVKKFKELSIYNNFKNIDYYKEYYYNIYNKHIERWPDQDFLQKIIYPIIRNDNISHISYESLRYSNNDILISIDNNFIGRVIEPCIKI